MIKVKVTKNVLNKKTKISFTPKQIVFAILGCAVGVATFFALKDHLHTDLLSTLIFIEAIVIIGFGVININGKNLLSFIIASAKKNDKRPYSISNTLKGEHKNEF